MRYRHFEHLFNMPLAHHLPKVLDSHPHILVYGDRVVGVFRIYFVIEASMVYGHKLGVTC